MVVAFDVDIAEFDSFWDPISTPPPPPISRAVAFFV
jgi:hypothetical protein